MTTRTADMRSAGIKGLALFLLGGMTVHAALWDPGDTRFLLESFTSFMVMEQVQGHNLGANLEESAKKEVDAAVNAWGVLGLIVSA
ncbi:MAG: hypothetical protein V2A34_10465 [Lentisphaerota bacterium]